MPPTTRSAPAALGLTCSMVSLILPQDHVRQAVDWIVSLCPQAGRDNLSQQLWRAGLMRLAMIQPDPMTGGQPYPGLTHRFDAPPPARLAAVASPDLSHAYVYDWTALLEDRPCVPTLLTRPPERRTVRAIVGGAPSPHAIQMYHDPSGEWVSAWPARVLFGSPLEADAEDTGPYVGEAIDAAAAVFERAEECVRWLGEARP